jgi:hypothetical protein
MIIDKIKLSSTIILTIANAVLFVLFSIQSGYLSQYSNLVNEQTGYCHKLHSIIEEQRKEIEIFRYNQEERLRGAK